MLVLVCCIQCRNTSTSIDPTAPAEPCNCFTMDNGYYERHAIFGDVHLRTTSKGNFLKRSALNDSMYVLSCGRSQIEYMIDTFKCNNMIDIPEVSYESDELLVLHQSGGTGVWSFAYYDLIEQKPVFRDQSIYFDTVQLVTVSINDLAFQVTKIDFGHHVTVKSDHLSPGVWPEDVQLNETELSYRIAEGNTFILDTVQIDWTQN